MINSVPLPKGALQAINAGLTVLTKQKYQARRGSDCVFLVEWWDDSPGGADGESDFRMLPEGGADGPYNYNPNFSAPFALIQRSSSEFITTGLYHYEFNSLTLDIPGFEQTLYVSDPNRTYSDEERQRQLERIATYYREDQESETPPQSMSRRVESQEVPASFARLSEAKSRATGQGLRLESQTPSGAEEQSGSAGQPETAAGTADRKNNVVMFGILGGTAAALLGMASGNAGLTGLGLLGGAGVTAYGVTKAQEDTRQRRPQAAPAVSSAAGSAPGRPEQSVSRRDLSAIATGDLIGGKYRVVSKLGEGGFGATFLVNDTTKNVVNTYVLKAQKLEGDPQQIDSLVERFEREAAALQQVGQAHGQIPSLIDYFEDQGNFFLVQEQVRGVTLWDRFLEMAQSGHLFANGYAIRLMTELLEVVQHLHAQGLLHRDIKPENIVLREGDDKPVLIDFGLVKEVGPNLETGTIAGTPGYMPYEQMLGKALYQSDLYALGMVFLLLTTGRPPSSLEPDESLNFDMDWAVEYLGEPLTAWLKKAIEPLPQNRFASAAEMRQALLELRDQALITQGMVQALEALENQPATGRSAEVDVQAVQQVRAARPLPSRLSRIVTTQQEIDAFNAVKRILERRGRDGELLELRDQPDFCDIHYRGQPELVVVRLYFNDRKNLAFAVPGESGEEVRYSIRTLRGISPKSDEIIRRLNAVEAQLGVAPVEDEDNDYVPDDDRDLIEQELRPLIVEQISESHGSDFDLLSLNVEEDPFRIYGQFAGQGTQSGRIFEYEVLQTKQGSWQMRHRLTPECLAQEQAREQEQQAEEDRLAASGVVTPGWLRRQFPMLRDAKAHYGIRVRSWEKLAEAINARNAG